jgi:hypothetical protein
MAVCLGGGSLFVSATIFCVCRNFPTSFWVDRIEKFRLKLELQHACPASRRSSYPWGTAAWVERTVSAAMVKSIYRFKPKWISLMGEFEVSAAVGLAICVDLNPPLPVRVIQNDGHPFVDGGNHRICRRRDD